MQLALDVLTKQTSQHIGVKEWLRKDQMYDRYPEDVADGKMAYLKTVPGSFKVARYNER